jgi:hypothetical protein
MIVPAATTFQGLREVSGSNAASTVQEKGGPKGRPFFYDKSVILPAASQKFAPVSIVDK